MHHATGFCLHRNDAVAGSGFCCGGAIGHARPQGDHWRPGRLFVVAINEGLQLGQTVGVAATVVLRSHTRQQTGQVVCAQPGGVESDKGQIGNAHRLRGHSIGDHALDGIGNASQGVDVGHAVDRAALRCCDDVIQERQVVCIAGGSTHVGSDCGVIGRTGIVIWRSVGHGVAGVGIGVIGLRKDAVVGIDDGLEFGHAVHGGAVNGTAVEGAVNGSQIVGVDAADAQVGVALHPGCAVAGSVVLRCSRDGRQRHVVAVDGTIDHRLHTCQGVEVGSVVGTAQRVLHCQQVLGVGPNHTQQLQLSHAGVAVHHRLYRIGQRLQLGHGVDRIGRADIDHIAQQGLFLHRVYACDAQGGVLIACGLNVIVIHTVCRSKNPVVRIDNGLHLLCGAGLLARDRRTVERAVDGLQVLCGDTADTCRCVGKDRRRSGAGVVGLRSISNGRQCSGSYRGLIAGCGVGFCACAFISTTASSSSACSGQRSCATGRRQRTAKDRHTHRCCTVKLLHELHIAAHVKPQLRHAHPALALGRGIWVCGPVAAHPVEFGIAVLIKIFNQQIGHSVHNARVQQLHHQIVAFARGPNLLRAHPFDQGPQLVFRRHMGLHPHSLSR